MGLGLGSGSGSSMLDAARHGAGSVTSRSDEHRWVVDGSVVAGDSPLGIVQVEVAVSPGHCQGQSKGHG